MKKFDEHTPGTTTSGADTEPLEELLESAHRDGFTPKETEEIWKRLNVALGAPAGGAGSRPSPGHAASAAGSALSAKTTAVLLLGGSIIATGGLMAVGISGLASHRAPPAVSIGTSHDLTAKDPGPPTGVEGQAVGGAAIEQPSAAPGLEPGSAPASVSPVPFVPSTPRGSATSHPSLGSRRLAAAGTATHPAGDPKAIDAIGQNTGAAATTASGVSTASTASTPSTASTASTTPRSGASEPAVNEGALLLRARQELAADPSATLKLTEEHAKLFPLGTLAPEREVLAIEALVKLGRVPEARARFAEFRSRFPQSPLLARLDALVGR